MFPTSLHQSLWLKLAWICALYKYSNNNNNDDDVWHVVWSAVSGRSFDDGGNYCASEVNEYNKRLDKLTQQVITTEQALTAQLKSIEPKKTEQIVKIIHDFEDR